MTVTIIGPSSTNVYERVTPPIVQVAPTWGADWTWAPELVLAQATTCAAGQDLDSCTLRRRYGAVKLPWESAIASKGAWNAAVNWWVRVSFVGPQGLHPVWIGRISGEARQLHGTQAHGPSGRQEFVAYGPLQILRKVHVGRSFWLVDEEEQEIGWVPSMNDRGDRGVLVGNRTTDKSGDTYLYGGSEIWTHRQYAEYILDRFVDESDSGGPAWYLGGQVDLLDDLKTSIRMRATQTAADVLRDLIPPDYGIDWTIFPWAGDGDNPAGFVVWVYALNAMEFGWKDKTLPRNPNTVRVIAGGSVGNVETHVISTEDHAYARIRVLGSRIVVCCSLQGRASNPTPQTASLVPKWDADLEAAYRAADDDGRKDERFRGVYQAFGAPDDWDHADGKAAPKLNNAGSYELGEVADHQLTVRSTLNWLPLHEGIDYSTDPPTDHNKPGHQPELRPPAAWIAYDQAVEFAGVESGASARWYPPVEYIGLHLHVPHNDWGIFLSGRPNHALAKNHWWANGDTDADGDEIELYYSEPEATEEAQPAYDHETLACTIAFEADQRLLFELALPDARAEDGVLEIEIDDCEYWFLVGGTIVGTLDGPVQVYEGQTNSPEAFKRAPTRGWILRDDTDRLALVMAGTIARYYGNRCRATITIKGLAPWGGLIGQILTLVQDGGSSQPMQAPITSVSWHYPDSQNQAPVTVIKAGYAR